MVSRLVWKLVKSRIGFLVGGAALMYFFDPDRGRSRRVQTASHLEGVLRRQTRRAFRDVERETHYLQGKAAGVAARARGAGVYHPESDVDLREHLRQVIHSLRVHTSDVTVDVSKGRATLRGQVDTEDDHLKIRMAVSAVPGVDDVVDYLHLPGTPAPNKVPG